MNLQQAISESFPEGIGYEDAAILCLRLYCSLDSVPAHLHSECNKEMISESFAQLYKDGLIIGPTCSSIIYGANFHSCEDKGHWVEIIASIFKKNMSYDQKKAKELVDKIQLKIEGHV